MIRSDGQEGFLISRKKETLRQRLGDFCPIPSRIDFIPELYMHYLTENYVDNDNRRDYWLYDWYLNNFII